MHKKTDIECKRGKLIVLEGIEGVGKTTIIEKISKFLEEKNIDYIVSREPGGIPVAEGIRNVIMNYDMNAEKEALLFSAARCVHLLEKIIPNLNEGKHVILDRYVMSSLCYQGYTRGLGIDKVYELNSLAVGDYMPDLNILLDMDPKESLGRLSKNKRDTNRFDLENLEFHQKNRMGFLILANKFKDTFKIVNADQTEEKVFSDTIEILEDILDIK